MILPRPLSQSRKRGPRHRYEAEQVHPHDGIPGIPWRIGQRLIAPNAHIVHQHIDLSEGPQYLVYGDLRSVLCSKIRHYGQHLGARDAATNVLGDRFDSFSGPVDERDLGAFLAEDLAGR